MTAAALSPDEGPRETLIEQLRTLERQWRRTEPPGVYTDCGLAAEEARHDCADDLAALLDAHAPAKGQE